jgi:type IV pilus assembly protein PilW
VKKILHPAKPHTRLDGPRQRGFSLIEIMVALVLGLVIIAGVIQIFISTQQSARVLEATSRMQENARLAVDTLGKYIRLAGLKRDPWTRHTVAFPAINPGLSPHALALGAAIAGGDNDQQNADSVTIRYQGSNDGSVSDCLGGVINPNQAVITTFALNQDANGRFTLRCQVQLVNLAGNAGIAGWPQTQPLLDDIEDMQIFYGVAATVDSMGRAGSAVRYVTATDVTNNNWWGQVISVRIDLLVRSEADNMTLEAQPITFNGVVYNDRHLRQVVSTVINLRNKTAR